MIKNISQDVRIRETSLRENIRNLQEDYKLKELSMFSWQSHWICVLRLQGDCFVATRFIMNKVYSAPRKDEPFDQ